MFRPCKMYVPHSIIVLYNRSLVNNVLYIFYLRKLWIDWRNSMCSMLFLLNKDKLCMLLYFHLLYTPFIVNRIGDVVVSVLASSAVDCGFEPRSGQTNNYTIYICCFSTKHAALMRESKDWSARNHNNGSKWSDMSTRGLFFQWASTIKIQLSLLV